MNNPFAYELKRLRRYRSRDGRCHELAIRLLLFSTTRDDIVLVQGTIFVICLELDGALDNIWHSWIEHVPTGMILDPVNAQVYEPAEYRELYDHEIWGRYARAEVSRRFCADHRSTLMFFPAIDAGVTYRGHGGLVGDHA
jgi:hypothetical protein